MSSIEQDQEQLRQKLEFLLQDDSPPTRQLTAQTPLVGGHSWKSFYSGAALSIFVVGAGALGAYLFQNASHTPTPVMPVTPPMVAIPAQIPTNVPLVPPTLIKKLHPNGLSAARSVITGIVDSESLTASYYWTFNLRNNTSSPKEAQMEIVLPAGAVVSRATLWINGRAEEAAFNSTENVQSAYNWIANLHRDPLLITQKGADRIMIKASPVVPGHPMKLRIGMTVPMTLNTQNQTELVLPYIVDSNVDLGGKQDIHLTSKSSMYSNRVDVQGGYSGKDFLLRGNIESANLQKLSIIGQRTSKETEFATRATHSFPSGYILAKLESDPIMNLNKLVLTKTVAKPDCPIINSDDAAYRLSYIWAKQEIERLCQSQNQFQAVELATVYRVVSPVSGAVVMERKSDYEAMGLDRQMYRSLSYAPEAGRVSTRRANTDKGEELAWHAGSGGASAKAALAADAFADVPLPSAGPVSRNAASMPMMEQSPPPISDAPALQGATNGTLGPIGNDAVVSETHSQNAQIVSSLLLVILGVFSFGGGALLLALAAKRAFKREQGCLKLATLGIVWMICAVAYPTASQMIAFLAGVLWCLKTANKKTSSN